MAEARPEVEPRIETDEPAIAPAARPGRRRRRQSASSGRSGSLRVVRMAYFGLASIWGFLAGTAAIIVALRLAGTPVQLAPSLGGVLFGAAAIAFAGGALLAVAYRQAVRR